MNVAATPQSPHEKHAAQVEMDLKEYFDDCAKHDWFYMYSDVASTYNSGRCERMRLEKLKSSSEHHETIFNDWYQFTVGNNGVEPEWNNYKDLSVVYHAH